MSRQSAFLSGWAGSLGGRNLQGCKSDGAVHYLPLLAPWNHHGPA